MSSIRLLRKRLRQNADSVQQAQAEQVKLNATLTLRREQYKRQKPALSRPEGALPAGRNDQRPGSYRDRLEAG